MNYGIWTNAIWYDMIEYDGIWNIRTVNIYELWSVDTNGHELYQVDSHGAALRQMAEAGKIQQVSIASPWSLDGEFLPDEFVTQKKGVPPGC